MYLSTVVTCCIASQRVFPLRFQPSLYQSVMIEMLNAVAGAFLCALVVFIWTYTRLRGPSSLNFFGLLFCAMALGYAIFFGMVRMGTSTIPKVAGIKQFDVFIAKLIFGVVSGLLIVGFITHIVVLYMSQSPDLIGYINVNVIKYRAKLPTQLKVMKEEIGRASCRERV